MAETKGELIILHDRRDRLEANRLVRKLESEGFRVARQDPTTPRRAKGDAPTVVLWSRHAAGRGLRSALDSEGAVIAKVDSRLAPSGAKVTDLRGWRGQDRHEGWKTLLQAVAPVASIAAPQNVASSQPTPPKTATSIGVAVDESAPEKKSILPAVVGVLAAAGVFAAAAYLFL